LPSGCVPDVEAGFLDRDDQVGLDVVATVEALGDALDLREGTQPPRRWRRTVTVGDTVRLDRHNATPRDAPIVFEDQASVSDTAVPVSAQGQRYRPRAWARSPISSIVTGAIVMAFRQVLARSGANRSQAPAAIDAV
jgi:hypothetical protein